MTARSVAFSRTRLTELMVPSFANFGGKVHGGVILSLMDKVAYACASKHAGAYCVTVTVDGVEFLQPVEVGDLLHLDATVHYVGNTSLVVGIKVTTENIKTNEVKHTNNSFFTMVAKDDNGTPVTVPELELTNHHEMRNFVTAIRRSKIRKEAQVKLQRDYDAFIPKEDFALVDAHRCTISFERDSAFDKTNSQCDEK
ncbi:acyl-CoA thioesterase [Alteromonas gracilis]|uniref:acyl-CoA thioesterase n=1 Tax=Alteromonas gracilis TaxID=1479524 RepID=UPI0036F2BBD0